MYKITAKVTLFKSFFLGGLKRIRDWKAAIASVRNLFFTSLLQRTIFKWLFTFSFFFFVPYCLCTYVPMQRFYFMRCSKPIKVNRNISIDAGDMNLFLFFLIKYFKELCKCTGIKETALRTRFW